MDIFARGFLRFVGFEYLILGIAGLAALFLRANFALGLCGVGALYLLVSPVTLTTYYGVQAQCLGEPGCKLDADVTQHARTIIAVLCIFSVAGGLSGVWAASGKDKQAGRAVWLALIVVSAAVALWNAKALLFVIPWYAIPSLCWAVAYAAAYVRWLRDKS